MKTLEIIKLEISEEEPSTILLLESPTLWFPWFSYGIVAQGLHKTAWLEPRCGQQSDMKAKDLEVLVVDEKVINRRQYRDYDF